ncbi:Serine protease inhibitor 1 [Capsicum annuum]|nr:Serine protease inhibitor 1 [Capsicum annuum]
MKKHILLLSFCLLPFVTFSYNHIELPTTKNDLPPVIFLVRDVNGEALQVGATYRIISPFWGAAGGDVYLGPSPNSDATCPNGVFRYISGRGRSGTPVTFTKFNYTGSSESGIHVTEDINIQFDNASSKLCGNNTTWRVGDFDVFQGARLLETGGTIIGSWFKIVKAPQSPIDRDIYVLLNCPGPLVCPSCPIDECQSVGVVLQEGKRRLALVRHQPLRVQFSKV